MLVVPNANASGTKLLAIILPLMHMHIYLVQYVSVYTIVHALACVCIATHIPWCV